MKIAISAHQATNDTPFSERFARCDYFIIYNTENNEWNAIENPAKDATGGAGTKVVQFLSENNITSVITGHYGPNAFKALKIASIKAYEAKEGTPEELYNQFLANKLKQVFSATGPGHH